MANEITQTVTQRVVTSDGAVYEVGNRNTQDDLGTGAPIHTFQAVGTVDEIIQLGDVALPASFYAVNRGTFTCIIKPGSGVLGLIDLALGDECLFPIHSGATVTAACPSGAGNLEYMVTPTA
jgi:hypothetical protein